MGTSSTRPLQLSGDIKLCAPLVATREQERAKAHRTVSETKELKKRSGAKNESFRPSWKPALVAHGSPFSATAQKRVDGGSWRVTGGVAKWTRSSKWSCFTAAGEVPG